MESNAKPIANVRPYVFTESEMIPIDPMKQIESSMQGSFKRGKENGMLDAEITLLEIANSQEYNITCAQLVNLFMDAMKTKREKL